MDRVGAESGGGIDTLDFSPTTSLAVTVNLGLATAQVVNANLTLNLGSATTFENVVGGSLGDTLTGNSLANSLTGGGGNDVLEGAGGIARCPVQHDPQRFCAEPTGPDPAAWTDGSVWHDFGLVASRTPSSGIAGVVFGR